MADEVLLVKKESLESVADAIREKSGSSEELEFPEGFIETIEETFSGIDFSFLQLSEVFNFTTNYIDFPECLELELPNISSIYIQNQSNVKIAKITVPDRKTIGFRLNKASNLKTILLPNILKPSTNATFQEDINLISIIGEIDMSAYSANAIFRVFYNCSSLIDLTLTPSSLKVTTTGTFTNCNALSDDSIISIANSLDESQSEKTITLPQIIKNKCQILMGDNVNGVFIFNSQGILSVSDFITTVKGWTLA